jgi:hypothetical protein
MSLVTLPENQPQLPTAKAESLPAVVMKSPTSDTPVIDLLKKAMPLLFDGENEHFGWSFMDEFLTPAAVLHALGKVLLAHGIPVREWNVEISNAPLAQARMIASNLPRREMFLYRVCPHFLVENQILTVSDASGYPDLVMTASPEEALRRVYHEAALGRPADGWNHEVTECDVNERLCSHYKLTDAVLSID